MQSPALILSIIVSLLFCEAFGAPENPSGADPAQAKGAMLAWIGVNRVVVRARFIRKEEAAIVLELESGEQRPFPITSFSPQSLKQADEEAEKLGDQSIARIRGMVFVPIKSGRFTMGSPIKETGRLSMLAAVPNPSDPPPTEDVEPERKVAIKQNFWLKETEVTWTEWNLVREQAVEYGYTDLATGRNGYKGDASGNHPVTEITWWDAVKWCNAKSQIEGKSVAYYITPGFKPADILMTGAPVPYVRWDASGYRLPTEAEWEYACRDGREAGFSEARHPGVTPLDDGLDKVAWYGGNSLGNTHPVKMKNPNKFKLHDMHGNVAEWCWDWAGNLSFADAEDPRGPNDGAYRIFRGGNWADPAVCCRAAYRGNYSPIAPSSCLVGFRPVCGSDPGIREAPASTRSRVRSSK